MTTIPPSTTNETVETLALAGIAHLQQEEAMLSETLCVLREIRSALVASDQEKLSELMQQRQQTEQSAVELQEGRSRLRQRIGALLQLGEGQVTLQTLASYVSGELRERLLTGRRRLLELTHEIDAVNRCNATIVGRSMNLLSQIMEQLTGHDSSPQRYSASGRLASGMQRPVLQREC